MIVGIVNITLYFPWLQNLKEKRMEVQQLISKLRNRFNISVIEAGAQDIHKTAIIGFVCAAAHKALADSTIDHVLTFIESNTSGEIVLVKRDLV